MSLLLPLSASCSRGSDYAIAHLRCAIDALPISFLLTLSPVSFSCRCVITALLILHSLLFPFSLSLVRSASARCALCIECRNFHVVRCKLRAVRCNRAYYGAVRVALCVAVRVAIAQSARCELCALCCASRVARCALQSARRAVTQRVGCCALRVARCLLRAARCALRVARCALCVATRCAFLFFAKERKEAKQGRKSRMRWQRESREKISWGKERKGCDCASEESHSAACTRGGGG